jgi:hypothetical protein
MGRALREPALGELLDNDGDDRSGEEHVIDDQNIAERGQLSLRRSEGFDTSPEGANVIGMETVGGIFQEIQTLNAW